MPGFRRGRDLRSWKENCVAPFDGNPKDLDSPPVRDSAAGDSLDELFKQPEGKASAAPGEFTKLFGKAPVPEPLDGIGAATPPAEVPGAAGAPVILPEPPATGVFAAPSMSTEEFSRAIEPPPPAAPATPTATSPAEPLRQPSEFTMLFGKPARQAAPEAAAKPFSEPAPEAAQGPKNWSGSFTQLFGATAQPPAPSVPRPLNPPDPEPPPAAKTPTPEEFANIFDFPLRDNSTSAEPAPKPGAGEFTAMFSRPVAPSPAPVAKDPGAFTQYFSRAEVEAAKPQRSEGLNQLLGTPTTERKDDSFIKRFGGGTNPIDNLSKPESYPPRSRDAVNQDPIGNLERGSGADEKPPGTAWAPPAPSYRSESTAPATQILKVPGATPAEPTAASLPPGPSAFTRIVSGDMVREAMQQAAMQAGPPASGAPSAPPAMGFPTPPMTPPAMPHIPPPAAPPAAMRMPPMVQMPHLQAPPVQMPQAPAARPPASPAAPAMINWMPVIIGVPVFLLIIAILILIFVLRR
jgi:hypothetical protein